MSIRAVASPVFLPGLLGGLGAMDAGALATLAAAIQKQEGWYPGSRSYRNNNPGNLRFAHQAGATADADGYAVFSSYPSGLAAEKFQITLDESRGTDAIGRPTTTVAELLKTWAPPNENDTRAYIAAVSASTGYSPNDSLSELGAGNVVSNIDGSTVSTGTSAADFVSSFLPDDFSGSLALPAGLDLGGDSGMIAAGIGAAALAYFVSRVLL